MIRKRFSEQELWELRNLIPVAYVLEQICGNECKVIEGYTRFVCPECHEMRTSIHPKENLCRCFNCARNFNAIELVMTSLNLPFVESVKVLQKHILKFQAARGSTEPGKRSSMSNIS